MKRREQLLQEAVVRVEHEPGADDRDPHAELLRAASGGLPGDAHSGVERGARPRGLVHDRVAAVAVVADGRLAHERAGPRIGGAQGVDEVLCRPLAAVADPLLRLVGPALVDGLADQVDDGVDALEGRGRRALGRCVPRVPADGRVRAPGSLGIAAQADDLVAAGEQRVAEAEPRNPLAPVTRTRMVSSPRSFDRREGAGLLREPRDAVAPAPPRPRPGPPRVRRRGRRRWG